MFNGGAARLQKLVPVLLIGTDFGKLPHWGDAVALHIPEIETAIGQHDDDGIADGVKLFDESIFLCAFGCEAA